MTCFSGAAVRKYSVKKTVPETFVRFTRNSFVPATLLKKKNGTDVFL